MIMFSGWYGAVRLKLIVFMTVAMATGAAHASMYRCTGANGAVAFSDRPCSDSKQETVDMKYKYDKTKPRLVAPEEAKTSAKSAPKTEPISPGNIPTPSTEQVVSIEDGLAERCVDEYRKHLAYPNGVKITGRTLEKRLDEMHIVVNVRTITNPATPTNIDPIFLNERFICVTDFGSGLNQRSTDIIVARRKKGQRF